MNVNAKQAKVSKLQKTKGITLVALVITIVILIILSTVTFNFTFGETGIITQAIMAKNETEVSIVKEALQLYYLNEELKGTSNNPIAENIEVGIIKDEVEQGLVVGDQGVDIADNIIYDRLFKLDQKTLGINVTKDRYYMDIETGQVYINNGIDLMSGKIYKLDVEGISTSNKNNILPDGSSIFAVGNTTYIVDKNGQMYGVGEVGVYNYLGINYIQEYDTTYRPQKTDIKIVPIEEASDSDFVDATSNGGNTFLLQKNGEVYAVGNNGYGILGVGDTAARYDLTKVKIDNVEKIYSMRNTAYFLKKDKTLWACGQNIISDNSSVSYNVISNEATESYSEPVQISYKENGVEVFENIKLVSQQKNGNHGIIIVKENGEVWSNVGYEYSGKFGDSSENKAIESPKRLTAIEELVSSKSSNIKQIYTTTTTTAILLDNKDVYTSGHNIDNGLGYNVNIFTKVIDDVDELYAGSTLNYGAFYAKKSNGDVYAWGDHVGIENGYTRLPTLLNIENIEKVVSGLVLTETGETYRVGLEIENKVIEQYTNIEAREIFEKGIIDKDNYLWVFGSYLIKDKGRKILLTKSELNDVERILTITGNLTKITIQRKDGSYASWGNNDYYSITDENTSYYVTPQDLTTTNAISSEITEIKKYLPAQYNSFIIDQNGNLWHKGYYTTMQTSGTISTFTKATAISNVKDVFCTAYGTIVQKEDGTLWAIGSNSRGGLGLGDTTMINTFTQITQDNEGNNIDFSKLAKVAQGFEKMTVLMDDGTIYTWGDNRSHSLGLNIDTSFITRPTKVTYFEEIGEKVIDIYDMGSNTIYLTEQGNVYVSGSNSFGQFGNGTRESSSIPQKAKIENVKQIIPGTSHVIAIKEDNSVWAWGAGGFGQLGTEKAQDELVPVPAYGLVKIDE